VYKFNYPFYNKKESVLYKKVLCVFLLSAPRNPHNIGGSGGILPALGNPGRQSRSGKDNATIWESNRGKSAAKQRVRDNKHNGRRSVET